MFLMSTHAHAKEISALSDHAKRVITGTQMLVTAFELLVVRSIANQVNGKTRITAFVGTGLSQRNVHLDVWFHSFCKKTPVIAFAPSKGAERVTSLIE